MFAFSHFMAFLKMTEQYFVLSELIHTAGYLCILKAILSKQTIPTLWWPIRKYSAEVLGNGKQEKPIRNPSL